MSVAVTKSPVAAAARTAMATSWSVARRVSPVTTPRRPEMSVGMPTTAAARPRKNSPICHWSGAKRTSSVPKPRSPMPVSPAPSRMPMRRRSSGAEDAGHAIVAARCSVNREGAHHLSSPPSSESPEDLEREPLEGDGDAQAVVAAANRRRYPTHDACDADGFFDGVAVEALANHRGVGPIFLGKRQEGLGIAPGLRDGFSAVGARKLDRRIGHGLGRGDAQSRRRPGPPSWRSRRR